MKKCIAFRADGGNVYSVGMGHVYRCVRIAKEMVGRDIECIFIMRDYREGIDFVKEAGFMPVRIEAAADVEKEIDTTLNHAEGRADALFVDLRMMKKELVRKAVERGMKTVVYEDIAQEELVPTILFNPSPVARQEERYRNGKTRYMLGEDYLVLDPVIDQNKRDVFSPGIKRVFLCFGGADPINLSSRVLKILLSRNEDITLDLALGPAFKNFEEINNIIMEMDRKKRTNLVVGNNRLPVISVQCDAAITSGGTCLFEVISQKIPVLGLPTIYSEARIISKMMDEGLTDGIREDTAGVGEIELEQKITSFLENSKLREDLFRNQVKKDLSGGLKRVVDHIESLIK